MENCLWSFYWDCGRSGEVEGLFVATEDEVKDAIGRQLYFGEILGKHSEIYGEFEENDIEKIDLDNETIKRVTEFLGDVWCGYNPLPYVKYKCSKCKDSWSSYDFDKELGICVYCRDEEN